ncbi:rRNA-processing protein and EBNA1-binding protein ebp2, partial [Tulasnella sp. 403]
MSRRSAVTLKPSKFSSKTLSSRRASGKQSKRPEVERDSGWSGMKRKAADESEGDDSEIDGTGEDIDQEGMEKLMKLLGEDGLDEIAKAQLGLDSEEDDDEEDDEEDGSEDEEEALDQDSDGGLPDSDKEDETMAERDEDAPVDPNELKSINNVIAIKRIREQIQLDPKLPWTETLVTIYPENLDDVDYNDDLKREVAFYKQALHSAQESRKLAEKHDLPFTRPDDYFAEMVKSDIHMERIRSKLLDEAATMKRSEDAKRQRNLKKFGKQIQIEREKERTKEKKATLQKVHDLKRKRSGALDRGQDDEFDVALDDTLDDRPAKRAATNGRGKTKMPRSARDQKYHWGSGTPAG